ncbi:MAG: 30S ribosome-binding factor RbfA [Alphaproteobacteria bacterium]|jgi:ribosome-binding factor A
MTKTPSKAPGQRQLRVGEEIRHALSEVLARGELRDPDLIDVSLTVSEVRISPDLRNATAFVVPLGGAMGGQSRDMALLLAALRRAAPFLRGCLGRVVKLRNTPALSFQADTSFDEASKIDALLRQSTRPVRDDEEADDSLGS